jgi:hypothetical protein
MKEQHDPPTGSEEDLRAENEVLKLKLELDHGMAGFGSRLSPKAENEWLKSVYDFEVMLKDSRGITIFDLIGRPVLTPWDKLKKETVKAELNKILALLHENGISLRNLEGADEGMFYRIITEELLPMKLADFGKGPLMSPAVAWFAQRDR